MRLSDRLVKQQQNENKKKQSQFEDEEWLTYKTRQKEKPLNEEPGAFYSTVFEGINSQKSAFDKSALFHTGQEG